MKRSLHGCPLLIWRDARGAVHALADCCLHQRSPVEVADFDSNQIVCPYHGWEYDGDGTLVNVPSDPLACSRMGNVSLERFDTAESDGFIWIRSGSDTLAAPPKLFDEGELNENSWRQRTFVKQFQTTEQLLIDNFMDPTHTGTIHAGLIRNAADSREHSMTITTRPQGVSVDFEESNENVGVALRWMLGRSVRVRHRDEFLLPNIVRVKYWFNDQLRFVALIACNATGQDSESANQRGDDQGTTALVQLRYRFGFLNFAVGLGLRFLAPRVLQQDFEITKKQFQNRKCFENVADRIVAADAVSVRVKQVRQQASVDEITESSITQKLKIRF